MFCNNCGHRNPPESNFCSSCGSPLTPSTDTTISFLPEDSSGDLADEEVSVPAGDLSDGTGVLVVKRGPDAGARFVLTGEVTRVGRHPDSEIFLDDVTVSRRHAEFRREAAHYVVADVGSLERHLRQPGADRDRHLERRRRGPDRQVQARLPLDERGLRSQWGSAPIWQLATFSPCSARSSRTSRSRRSVSSRAGACSFPSGRRPATASSTSPTSTAFAGSCASSASTSCPSR